MKKFFLCLVISLLLCSCKKANPEYLVSAIGFDYKTGQYKVSFEAVISNSETNNQEVKVISGSDKTIKKAISEIKRQSTQSLLLSHCAVLVIGENINDKRFDEICDFVLDNKQITLSTILVKSKNAKKLLTQKPISSVAVGFDIVSLLEQNNKSSDLKNRYFEVMANGNKPKLPEIALKKEGYYLEN